MIEIKLSISQEDVIRLTQDLKSSSLYSHRLVMRILDLVEDGNEKRGKDAEEFAQIFRDWHDSLSDSIENDNELFDADDVIPSIFSR